MRLRRWHTYFWLVLGAGCVGSPAEETSAGPPPPAVEVRSAVDKAVATTGDLITYEVVVERQEGIVVTIPDPGDQIAGFRLVDMGTDPPRKQGGRVIERRWYALRADLVGSYILPPVSVTYDEPGEKEGEAAPKALTTSEIFVEVASVLPEDGSATDIRDIKPLEPVAGEIPWLWISLGVGLALAGAALGILVWRRRRRQIPAPVIPPHQIAFAALDELRQTDFADRDALRAYYFRISEVLRAYVEGRFALNATDLTSEEILARLGQVEELRTGPRVKLEDFLSHTDLVKFADREPSTAEVGETYEQALSFVEETVAVEQTPTGPARAEVSR